MKIAVIGAGAMGSIYGGRLSLKHEVYLIDKNSAMVDVVNQHGLKLEENGTCETCHPKAVLSSEEIGQVDLVILFVKAMFSRAALEENKNLLGSNTYIMTLQNGSGHEEIIHAFVPLERIIIGTTEDNGTVIEPGYVKRGGKGKTNIGMPVGNQKDVLEGIKEAFDACGFQVCIHDDIHRLIWDKLFTNVSLSVVTGVLQVPMGYISKNSYAFQMTVQLIQEAVAVAHAMGMNFDEQVMIDRVKITSTHSPDGYTSIYMDICNHRKTEVDTITGSVVRAAQKVGVAVPTHRFILNMIHALEQKESEL